MITTKFAKASERTTGASPFCLIEQKGLLARLGEELSRAANDLFHDPRGFIRDLVSPADTKDQKHRRLVYIGLGCALVAHAVLLTVMIVAGWHRVLAPLPQNVGGYEVTFPKFAAKSADLPKEAGPTESAPKGDPHQGGGGGGQLDPTPVPKGGPLPTFATPPIIKFNAPSVQNPNPTTLAITPSIQGPADQAPPPEPPGDPNGKPGNLSAGPGRGDGLGNGNGNGQGNGAGAGRDLGTKAGKGGGNAGALDGNGTAIDSLYFNGPPKPAGYVPFSWIYRPTPVVTPEAQKNKSSGTVILIATFRANGTITDIEIKNQVDYMTESAVEALKRARFRPASINGVPITMFRVPVRIDIELTGQGRH